MSERIARFVGLILADFVRAWVLMLTMGWIHSKYIEVPAVGYWVAFLVVIAADQLQKVDLDKVRD